MKCQAQDCDREIGEYVYCSIECSAYGEAQQKENEMKDTEEHYCIVCEKVTENHGDCLSNVSKFNMGYGSKLDCDVYDVTICDACLVEKREKGIVKYLYNHLDVEQSKKRFIASLTPEDEEWEEYYDADGNRKENT